jgi:hypothetical protein
MLHGGGVYGAGAHGETIDVGEIEGDDRTLYAELVAAGPGAELVLYVQGRRASKTSKGMSASASGGLTEVKATAQQAARVLRAVRGAREMIAKHFFAFSGLTDTKTKTKFMKELETNVKVRRAYGRDAERFTTLGELDVGGGLRLLGLHIRRRIAEGEDATDYYAFGNRCGPTLGGYDWSSASMAEVDALVRQTLDSLARLHAAGMLHNDIHMENLIYCAPSKRFKFIDWGTSAEISEMRSGNDLHHKPRSPLGWFVMGAGPHTMALAIVKCASPYKSVFLTSLRFQAFIYGAVLSGNRLIARMMRSSGLDELAVRRAIMASMLPSFDLFNLGIGYASIAVRCGDSEASERLMKLAERLTHYDDDETYIGNDAAAALRTWIRSTSGS